MGLKEIIDELKSLGKERTKKLYMSNGAKEPVFGVTISAMKPIFNKIKYNQPLAEQLYATEYIQNEVDKGKLGFKRKHVRC